MASGHHGRWGRVTAGTWREEGGAAINCHKMQVKEGRGRGRSGAGATGAATARDRAGQGKERGRRRRRRRRQVGPGCQRLTRKKEKGRRAAAGKG
jgi:hypothetical protein